MFLFYTNTLIYFLKKRRLLNKQQIKIISVKKSSPILSSFFNTVSTHVENKAVPILNGTKSMTLSIKCRLFSWSKKIVITLEEKCN